MIKKLIANFLIDGKLVYAETSFSKKIQSIKILGTFRKDIPTIIPGFVDLHIHGGGGADVMEGNNAIKTIAQTHLKFGTTSFLATTMTAPQDHLVKAFEAMKPSFIQKERSEARLLGVHLEGPYLSAEKLGAQPNATREAKLEEIKILSEIVPIKNITIAPEVFKHMDLIKDLCSQGIVVQIGHTNGSYEEGVMALKTGAKSFTHLFNAMSPFHHRTPGMVGAALAHADHAELIPDLLHVHPGAIHTALRCIPNLYFVTDATAATGMPDGNYKLGSMSVHKCLGGVRLQDGTLAGSCLTMSQAFGNLIQLGLSIEEASRRLSQIPAELIGERNRGIIKVDAYADLLVLGNDHTIKEIYSEGELV